MSRWTCLEHESTQNVGEVCSGLVKGTCQRCGCWVGDHYAAYTNAGGWTAGCTGIASGGDYGEYNVPCRCEGFRGDVTASYAPCRPRREVTV